MSIQLVVAKLPAPRRQVKANSLSGGGRVSWVRLAGLFGLVGLSWDRAKPLTHAGLNLIPLSRVRLGRVNLRFSFV
jgi:hypothetical protein